MGGGTALVLDTSLRRGLVKLKKELKAERILLFGSRAKGDALEDSDVDILIVSKRFDDVPWLQRVRKVLERWEGRLPLEPICLTPSEFEKRKDELSIVGEAIREGVQV